PLDTTTRSLHDALPIYVATHPIAPFAPRDRAARRKAPALELHARAVSAYPVGAFAAHPRAARRVAPSLQLDSRIPISTDLICALDRKSTRLNSSHQIIS